MRLVFLQKLFSWGNKPIWLKREPVSFPHVLPFSPWTQGYSCGSGSQLVDARYLAVPQDLGCYGTEQLLNWQREGLCFLCNVTQGPSKAWARCTTAVDVDTESLPPQKGDMLAHSRVLLYNSIRALLGKPTNPFNEYSHIALVL